MVVVPGVGSWWGEKEEVMNIIDIMGEKIFLSERIQVAYNLS